MRVERRPEARDLVVGRADRQALARRSSSVISSALRRIASTGRSAADATP